MPLKGRYARAVRALFGLEANQVGILPELIPTVEVMSADSLTAFPRGEYLYGCTVSIAAVAGQQAVVTFRNPADSTKACVVQLVEFWSSSGAAYAILEMERGGTAMATAVAVASRDPRVWSDIPPYTIPHGIEVSRGTAAVPPAAGELAYFITSAANVKDQYIGDVIILPGTSMYLICGAANVQMSSNFIFYERNIDAAEYG